MRNMYRGATVALTILAGSTILGHGTAQNLSITNFQVVSQQQITPTLSRVIYRADLVNPGSSFASVSATASSTNPFAVRIVPGSDTLMFAPVPANSQTTSLNTFTVLASPNFTLSASNLSFTFQAVAGPLSANAGPDQNALLGSLVTLNGSGSTSSGGPLTYSWVFVSLPPGSATVLNSPASVMPTFRVDVAGTYVIQLTVSSGGQSSSAIVHVSTTHVAPVANAGPNQTVLVGVTVTLDGSGSFDMNGSPLTYAWLFGSKPAGSQATLTGANTVNPTFVVDLAGTYTIQLLVNDGVSNSNFATVTVSTVSSLPVANAGPSQVVPLGSTVTLNGAGSTDTDGNPLTYSWSLILAPDNSTAALTNPTTVNPTFTADLAGTYIAQLIVHDSTVASLPVTVVVSTAGSPLPPTANAGPNQTVEHGATVKLAGSGVDPQGLPLTYKWAILSKPSDSSAVLSSTTIANPTFVADAPGTYVLQLMVNDGVQGSIPSTVTISTNATAPVANPGSNSATAIGGTVTLNGSASTDSNNQPLTYSWSLLSVPTGSNAKLQGATTVSPTFVADVAGTYVAQLIVNDGFLPSLPKTVTITASSNGITLSPSTLTLTSGPGVLTVMLTGAPTSPTGLVITLVSSNPSAVAVPSSITIPQGQTSATIAVSPGGTQGTSTISATASGYSAGSASVTSNISQIILPSGISLSPNQSANFQVTLVTPSPSGTFVSLSSSDPTVITVNPTFFYIQPGATTWYKPPTVTAVGFGSATITASASGLASASQVVIAGVGFTPTNLAITGTAQGVLSLTLPSPAPSGGLTVNLSVDNPAVASVPGTVVVPANSISATVVVTGKAAGATVVHASAAGTLPDVTALVTVTSAPQIVLPAFVSIGQWSASGPMAITLSSPAPAGGVTISLTTVNSSICSVSPASIFIPAGATTPTSLPILTGTDLGYTNLTASAPGYLPTTIRVTDTDDSTIGMEDFLTLSVGQTVPYVVSLPAAAQTGGVTITLTSSNPSVLTIAPSVFIPAGQLEASVPIEVKGLSIGTVTIQASAAGYSTEFQTIQVTQ
jgi:hypothetical protein